MSDARKDHGDSVIHLLTKNGNGLTLCCGRPHLDVSWRDRITMNKKAATCRGNTQ